MLSAAEDALALRETDTPEWMMCDATRSGVRLEILEAESRTILQLIDTTPVGCGLGLGTEFMERLIRWADVHGKLLALNLGAIDPDRLREFYKRFGFVENEGRKKVFGIEERMIRQPG